MSIELGIQNWNADEYARTAPYVAKLGNDVLRLLAPKPGEQILDLGCGDGVLTAKIAHAGARVVGIDASEDMVERTRSTGLPAEVMDAEELTFDGDFDAVFSNAAIHWLQRPDDMLKGVRRALRHDGRFVGEFGGFGNVAAIISVIIEVLNAHGFDGSALNPWYNPSVRSFASKLEEAGFRVVHIESIARPTLLPQGLSTWLDVFAKPFFEPTGAHAPKLKLAVIEALEPILRDEAGNWIADHVRLRFAAFVA
jgi:SAM-dependent methyltransferase